MIVAAASRTKALLPFEEARAILAPGVELNRGDFAEVYPL